MDPTFKFEGMEPITAEVGKHHGFTLGEDHFIVLTDDNFFMNGDWIVQADLMDGKECVVVVAEYQHNIYVEVEPRSDHELHEVIVTAE